MSSSVQNFRQNKKIIAIKKKKKKYMLHEPFVTAAIMRNLAQIKCDQACKEIVIGCYYHMFSAAKYIFSKLGFPLM